MNDSTTTCPRCGKPVARIELMGLCPDCMLKAGLGSLADRTAVARSRHFAPPTVAELSGKFPQLDILELIGSGGMGVVYLVEDEKLARPFAAKTFARIGGTEDERRRRDDRFAAEARAQANIRHDHILRVVASGFDDALGVDFFVMDAVLVTQAALEALCRDVLRCAPPADAGDGPRAVSLEDLLAGGKTLGEAETVRILRE